MPSTNKERPGSSGEATRLLNARPLPIESQALSAASSLGVEGRPKSWACDDRQLYHKDAVVCESVRAFNPTELTRPVLSTRASAS